MKQHKEAASTRPGFTITTLDREEVQVAVFIATYGRKPTKDELKRSYLTICEEHHSCKWQLDLKLIDAVEEKP